MELLIAKFPVYGISLKTGTMETFSTQEEAFNFLHRKETATTPRKLPIHRKKQQLSEFDDVCVEALQQFEYVEQLKK